MKTIFIVFTTLYIACAFKSEHQDSIVLEAKKDSCYVLNDSVNRRIEIVENTLDDTVLLGLSVLPKGYTGKFLYVKFGTATNKAMYPKTPDAYMPKTDMFCIDLYQRRPANGRIVIRFKK